MGSANEDAAELPPAVQERFIDKAMKEAAEANAWRAEVEAAKDHEIAPLVWFLENLRNVVAPDIRLSLQDAVRIAWRRREELMLRPGDPDAAKEIASLRDKVRQLEVQNETYKTLERNLLNSDALLEAIRNGFRLGSAHRAATAVAGGISVVPKTELKKVGALIVENLKTKE